MPCRRRITAGPLAFYYLSRGLSLLLLPFIHTPGTMLVFAILYGLNWISTVPPTAALAADRFGRQNVGTVFGWIFCAHQIGAAVAAYEAFVIWPPSRGCRRTVKTYRANAGSSSRKRTPGPQASRRNSSAAETSHRARVPPSRLSS